MKFEIPESLKAEHEELHEELAGAMKAGGKVGSAAKKVAEVLHPHFAKEEEYALPPLGLLRVVATGKVDLEMGEVLDMTNKLKSELNQMLEEHKAIVASLESLVKAARKENKMEYARFAEKLKMHALNEEEVLYPASLLIGEYVGMRVEHLQYEGHSAGCC
ncbi:MAG: hemerythrin domain-containing protein [Methanomassiliicoccales archaeon]|nr:hemerythrin domain-containing protein [Methanomassiliicoccales archaeon]